MYSNSLRGEAYGYDRRLQCDIEFLQETGYLVPADQSREAHPGLDPELVGQGLQIRPCGTVPGHDQPQAGCRAVAGHRAENQIDPVPGAHEADEPEHDFPRPVLPAPDGEKLVLVDRIRDDLDPRRRGPWAISIDRSTSVTQRSDRRDARPSVRESAPAARSERPPFLRRSSASGEFTST